VGRVLDLRTQHIGPDQLLVGGQLEFDHPLTPRVTDAIDEVERAIWATVPVAHRIYIEPDMFDPHHGEVNDVLTQPPSPNLSTIS